MRKKNVLATIALSAVLLTGCGCNKFNQDTIIKVNNDNITKQEYQKAFDTLANNSMFSKMGFDVKKETNSFLHLMIKDRVVNELVVKSLLDQEIKNKNIKVSKEEVENELKSLIDTVGSKEKFNEILKQEGISTKQFKEDLEEQVKIKKLIESIKKVDVSDSEVKKYYDDNKNKFIQPEKVRASHILITSNEAEIRHKLASEAKVPEAKLDEQVKLQMDANYEKAKKLLNELKKDPSQFAKIARENSDDQGSAKLGGDIGFFAKEEMVEPFSKVAFSLKPQTLSDIVQTPYGYHIILVTDRTKAGVVPFEKVKEEIKNYLKNSQQVKILQDYVDKLRKDASIKYVDSSFDPANIQKQIKEQAKENSELMGKDNIQNSSNGKLEEKTKK